MANAIVEAAEKMPEILGLSLLGEGTGKTKDKDGNTIIESIDRVFSVDLVANPATVTSLYESEEEEESEEEDSDLSAEEHVWEGVKKAIMACLDADGDVNEKVKAIKDLLKHHDKMFGEDEEADEEVIQTWKNHIKQLALKYVNKLE